MGKLRYAQCHLPPFFCSGWKSKRLFTEGKGCAVLCLADVMRNVWYWNYLRFLREGHYPLWLFYIDGTLTEKDRWLSCIAALGHGWLAWWGCKLPTPPLRRALSKKRPKMGLKQIVKGFVFEGKKTFLADLRLFVVDSLAF